jgi:hypothetical protein
MIYLQHRAAFVKTENARYRRFLRILKDGYLRPGYKTGVYSRYGRPGSRWVYVSIPIIDDFDHTNIQIDPMCLLETRFVIHDRWKSEDNIDPKAIIDGRTLTSDQLKRMLSRFRNRMRRKYLLGKKSLDRSLHRGELTEDEYDSNIFTLELKTCWNEILIEDDVDLRIYLRRVNMLRSCVGTQRPKLEKQLHYYILKEYPKVKIECLNE